MAVKSKKAEQSPLHKESTKAPRSWPDLPTQPLTILARNSTLMQNISYGGNVTKSYRLPPRQCNPIEKSPFPRLSINDDGQTDRCHDDFQYLPDIFNITFRVGHLRWFGRRPPCRYSADYFVGYSQGMLVARGGVEPSDRYYLWDPIDRVCGMLPLWDVSVPFKHVALSSSPKDHKSICTVMVLTGIKRPAFAFCDLRGGIQKPTFSFRDLREAGNKYAWFQQDSTLVEPHSSNHPLMQFTNAIGLEGKFYALSLQGILAVMEKIDSHFRITSLGTNRAVPSVHAMHFKEYLIESNGEILLVFLVSRKSIHRVENVEVYRLRFDRLSWVKMESIGDRTLFVGTNCCMSVNASKIGCKVDCIYFSNQTVGEWLVYDMERGSISPGWENYDSSTRAPVR
ncbi:uncharacterized protein LOC131326707 isoform X1 [Rhododendron vialii]|uniref:uncharacterized protein LOC131326707 isoform X1 n=1 Tax=Rhododendron vialii TaxID=182163 RepID=UPI00265E801C|nr:uncharacterized protein LOC131326707 isoform X1 [Rhododendron vialii]